MRRYFWKCHFLVGICFLVACSSNQRVKESFAGIKTVSLAPLEFVDVPVNSQQSARKIESMIAAKLEQSGFEVILSSEYQDIQPSAVPQAGNPESPNGDAKLTEKTSPAIERTEKKAVDAVLYPTVKIALADFKERLARWEGVSQMVPEDIAPSCSGCGRVLHFYDGEVPASSLNLKIVDANNETIYTGSGGIEITLRYVHRGFTEAGFERIPDEELFQDKNRIDRAVRLALEPIIE